MRKSSLVKAMACFMAATMAITCVPSANVTNGVSITAEAAENESDLTPVFSLDFEGELPKGCEIVGNGKIETSNTEHGKVFHNSADGQGIRKNYILLPEDTLAKAVKEKGELTISMDVNVGTAKDFYHSPLFSAHDSKKEENDDSWNMFQISAKGYVYVNTTVQGGENSYEDLKEDHPDKTNEGTQYLDDKEWHKVTVTITKSQVVYYIDGEVFNKFNVRHNGFDTFLTQKGAAALKYICLGGCHYGAGIWKDPDPAFLFDNVAIYSSALTDAQVRKLGGVNICTDMTLTSESYSDVAVNVPFELKATAKGEDPEESVTDTVTAAAINADIKITKEFDGKECILSVTPTNVDNGAVTVTCGAIGKTYSFQAAKNSVKELMSVNGMKTSAKTDPVPVFEFSAKADQAVAFEVKAIANNSKIGLDDKIKVVSGSSLIIIPEKDKDGNIKDETIHEIGFNSLKVVSKILSGKNEFKFECGGKELIVIVTGNSNAAPGTSTDTNKPAEDTNKPAEDTNKPAEDTNKPAEDTNKPAEDTNKPAEDTNKPAEDTNKPEDDKNNTTKKKKVKITSATAKKSKKVVTVSGKVTKKATVKVTAAKKTLKTTANKSGKFSVKFSQKISKKIKKKAKVKIVVTKSGYKKATKTIKVK